MLIEKNLAEEALSVEILISEMSVKPVLPILSAEKP